MNPSSSKSRSRLARDIAIAGFLLAASALLAWLTPEVISRDVSGRTLGVLLGLLVMAYANEAPKALPRLDRIRNPVTEQARRRFAGWAITVGGIAYLITWLIAPVKYAAPISMTLLALSVVAPMGRCLLARRRGASDPSASVLG